MMDRNKKARIDAVENVRKAVANASAADTRLRMRQLENYVVNRFNGNFFLARWNQVNEQITSGIILENLDGIPKTKDYLMYEGLMAKHRAVKSFGYAWVARKELIAKGVTDKEIDDYYVSYITKPVLREDYSDIVDVDDQMPRFE